MTLEVQPEQSSKSNLLKFQQFLNDQFMEIYRAEIEQGGLQLDVAKVADISNELGLKFKSAEATWFIPLKHLLHISAKAEFEPTYLTHDWIRGFNHFRGEVYTVVDVSRYMGGERKEISLNTRLVMLRNINKAKVALLIDNIDLSHAADFTLLYRFSTDKTEWNLHEDVSSVEDFLDRKVLSKLEANIIENISARKEKYENLPLMPVVGDLFMDGYKPVFVLNTEAMLEDMSNRSPF